MGCSKAMTQGVTKVTHQEAVLASSEIKWKENINNEQMGDGESSEQGYIIKVLQKNSCSSI